MIWSWSGQHPHTPDYLMMAAVVADDDHYGRGGRASYVLSRAVFISWPVCPFACGAARRMRRSPLLQPLDLLLPRSRPSSDPLVGQGVDERVDGLGKRGAAQAGVRQGEGKISAYLLAGQSICLSSRRMRRSPPAGGAFIRSPTILALA
jgi:hypothetical protein